MSILSAVRDIDRLRQITQVLVRHGFGEVVTRLGLGSGTSDADGQRVPRPRFGERLRLVLQDLGPTFVKLGQIVSTRSDVIPADIVLELKKLQDEVPPFSEAEARRQIEETLGTTVEALYETFEGKPLASASVAQVHRATLRVEGVPDPVPVAVKIQRPGIPDTIQRDLDLLYVLARLVESAIPEARVYSPTGLVQEFDRSVTAELDFLQEAQNAVTFAENFAGDEAITFPKVYPRASGKRVLTLGFLDGVKVTDAVKRGADGEWIAKESVRIILKMVFEDGFFHADPHPGNVLVLPRPEERYAPGQPVKIGLLDLGLVGRLSPALRDKSVDLLLAAARKDPDGMADAMLSIGRTRGPIDREAFREYVRRLAEKHLKSSLKSLDAAAILRDIVLGAMKFEIEIPVELTMMIRAMMTMEGVGKEIYPDLDLFAVAKPYLTRTIWQRYHPLRLGEELLRGVSRLGGLARDLPFQLKDILEDLRQGRLKLQTRDPERARALDLLGRRIRASVVSVGLLGSGVTLLAVGQDSRIAWVLFGAAFVFFSTHLLLDLFGRRGKD
jgi:ubiquinone biosynthesis protein